MEVPKHFSLGRPAGILVDGDVEIALYFLSVHMVTWHKNKARKLIPFEIKSRHVYIGDPLGDRFG